MFPFFSAAYSSTPLSLNLKILLTLSWEFKSNTRKAAAWHAIPVSIADTKTTPYTKSVNQKHSSLFLFFCKVQYVLFCSDQQYFRIPDNIHCTNAKYHRDYMASFKLNIALWRYNHFFGILRRIPHKIIKSDRIRFLIHFDFWCCLKHCFILTLIIIYFMFEKCKMFLHSFYNFTLAIYFTFW